MDNNEIRSVVLAAAGGDERAWGTLVHDYSGAILGRTRSFRLNQADTEDVVQTVWMKLIEHIGSLREAAAIGGWLSQTAHRECLRLYRRREYACDVEGFGLVDPADGPEAVLVPQSEFETLSGALGQLQERDQTLLGILMEDANPCYQQVSQTLGMPIGSIGPTRGRALNRLRREYDALVA